MATVTLPVDISPADLVQRAAEMRPLVAKLADQAERDRHISPDIIDAARERGIFRILQPKRFGGLEYDLATAVRCLIEIGSADASSAWVCGLGIAHQWLIAQFPLQCQEDIWGDDPGTLACGSYAPAGTCEPVDGGYRVSGRFQFTSGVDVLDWKLIGVFIPADDGGDRKMPGFLMIPPGDYTVEDDWHVMGLAATGSKSIVCEDIFVPRHRRVTFAEISSGTAPGCDVHDGRIYRYPFLSLIAYCIASPAVGCLNGALESFIDSMTSRTTRGAVVLGGNKVREFQAVQMRVGRAAASLKAAKAMLFEQIEESRAKIVDRGELLDVGDRMDNRITQAKIVDLSIEGLEELFGAVGGQGIQLSQHVQRAWRDAHAIAHHVSFNRDALTSMYGQHLLGLEPQGQY